MIPVPERMTHLERDRRGYPIPWNVLRDADDGTPFFVVNDDRRQKQAFRESRCPICGGLLGRWRWFVGGPLSAFDPNGWYVDLPGHHECIQFALQTCPYLAMPSYGHRIDGILVAHREKLKKLNPPILLDETVIPDRPEIFVAVAGSKIEVAPRGPLQPYVRPTRPLLGIEFWQHSRRIDAAAARPALRRALGEAFTLPVGVGL